jgi:hypothetical protein
MSSKLLLTALLVTQLGCAAATTFPLNRAYLQSNLNGNTNSVTNLTSLHFKNLTSDPSSPLDGSLWFRSDTGKFRSRIAGASANFGAVGSSDLTGLIATNLLLVRPLDATFTNLYATVLYTPALLADTALITNSFSAATVNSVDLFSSGTAQMLDLDVLGTSRFAGSVGMTNLTVTNNANIAGTTRLNTVVITNNASVGGTMTMANGVFTTLSGGTAAIDALTIDASLVVNLGATTLLDALEAGAARFNSLFVTNAISAGSLATPAITAGGITTTNTMSAGVVSTPDARVGGLAVTNAITAATVAASTSVATPTVTANNVTATNGVTAATVAASTSVATPTVTANNVTATNALTAATVAATTSVSTPQGYFGNLTVTNTLTTVDVQRAVTASFNDLTVTNSLAFKGTTPAVGSILTATSTGGVADWTGSSGASPSLWFLYNLAWKDFGWSAGTSAGASWGIQTATLSAGTTTFIAPATEMAAVNLISTTSSNNAVAYFSENAFSSAANLQIGWLVMPHSGANARYFVGITRGGNQNAQVQADTPGIDMAGFQFVNNGSTANTTWQYGVCDNTTTSVSDSSVTIVTNSPTMFWLVGNDGGTGFDFYINGSLVGSKSSNLPRTSQAYAVQAAASTQTSASKAIKIYFIRGRSRISL